MWNLPPPPGFQGLHLDKQMLVYQRHLPHWRQDGATYFVTFHLADSLPKSKRAELEALKVEWERRHTPPWSNEVQEELARQVHERVERWLDQGMGCCVLKQGLLAALVTSSMHHFDDDQYELDCYAIMPNHAHVILRPLIPELHSLEAILGSWKKYSSRRINWELKRRGELWEEESYDRIIRDEEHLWRAIQYIGSNPQKAGLPPDTCPVWIRPQWAEIGWQFEAPKVKRVWRPVLP